jgi:hypothetical protein
MQFAKKEGRIFKRQYIYTLSLLLKKSETLGYFHVPINIFKYEEGFFVSLNNLLRHKS